MRKVFQCCGLCYKTHRSCAGRRGQEKETTLHKSLAVPAERAPQGMAPGVTNPSPSVSDLCQTPVQSSPDSRSISVLLRQETRSLCSQGCSSSATHTNSHLLLNIVRSEASVSNPEFPQTWAKVRHLPWVLLCAWFLSCMYSQVAAPIKNHSRFRLASSCLCIFYRHVLHFFKSPEFLLINLFF